MQLIENDEIVVVRRDGVEFLTPTASRSSATSTRSTGARRPPRRAATRRSCSRRSTSRPTRSPRRSPTAPSRGDGVDLDDLGTIDDDFLRDFNRIVVVACGTCYHAGLIGRYAIEEWARVPVEMDIASEYRYRNPVVGPGDLVIGITQSGETADTLAAMRLARERGAKVLAITNVMGSQATRDADGVLYTRAGLEIGVAATKTFVAQVAAMYLLALRLAELRGHAGARAPARAGRRAQAHPAPHRRAARRARPTRSTASPSATTSAEFFLYLGRHVGLPVALEGALKLKEISYIATDAYAAGEMKHGPIALLDEKTPVVVVATDSPVLEKVVSNMQEVRARGAHVIAVATEGDDDDRRARRGGPPHPADRLDAAAAARGDPAAAAGLPDRAPARAERRPAAQPRQDRHGRVARSRRGRQRLARPARTTCARWLASVRLRRPRLPVDVGEVNFTVCSVTVSCRATRWLDRPDATRRRTSDSRSVR